MFAMIITLVAMHPVDNSCQSETGQLSDARRAPMVASDKVLLLRKETEALLSPLYEAAALHQLVETAV